MVWLNVIINTSLTPPLFSDSAVKQILLTLDERPGQSFIIEDLDEFHVLIRADEEQRVRRELEAEVCSRHDVFFCPPSHS